MDKFVVSLEVAKQLNEAGWSKRTVSWYTKMSIDDDGWEVVSFGKDSISNTFRDYISAPIAEEILEELPNYIQIDKAGGSRHGEFGYYIVTSDGNRRDEFLMRQTKEVKWQSFEERNLANALAKCWIYLKKNNLL